MKKIIPILAIALAVISIYFLRDTSKTDVQIGAVVENVARTAFMGNVTFTTSNVHFATSTDENENEITTGLAIPIRIATSTGFTDETIEMNFGAYNQCRVVKTKTVCLGELNDDIQQNIEAFKENKLRELEELKRPSYQDEIIL